MTKGATQEIERELTVLLRGAHRALLSAVEGDIALDRAAYGTMCKLADDGPQHLAALANAFELDPSTITRQVKTLEAAGLAARHRHPSDRRVVVLELTARGRRLLEQARSHRRAKVQQALADWSEADRHDLGRLIKELNASIPRLRDY